MEDRRPSDPEIVGSYRILGRIGAGGMGIVYLAQNRFGDRVALKLIRRELADDAAFRARFRGEVEAGQRVGGVCTARYLEADLDSETPYLVTEFAEGGSLQDQVAANGPLSGDQLVTLAVGLAEALVAMDAVGVVHRDLKPSNVLMASTGPKVVDFGIARAADGAPVTQTGTVIGSPGWMAPEQAVGGGTSPAIDVFAWGATVAFAGTGRSPFGDGPPEAILYRVVHEEPDLRGLDPRLEPTVRLTLEKEPLRRPSADQLLLHLVRTAVPGASPAVASGAAPTAVIGQTWQHRPVAPVTVASRGRRRTGWIVAATLVLLVGAIGLGTLAVAHAKNHEAAPTSTGRPRSPAPAAASSSTSTTTPPTTGAPVSPVSPGPPATSNGQPAGAFDYAAAVRTIEDLGYTMADPESSEEDAGGPLYVLTAECAGTIDGYCQNAFFFVGNHYIGKDIAGTDQSVGLVWQTGTTAALSYPLYGEGDLSCCPTGGDRTVRFYWNGSHLSPLDPLPSDPNQVSAS